MIRKIQQMVSRMIDAVCRWHDDWKSPPPPVAMVPQEVKDESHALSNAVMVARHHIQRAEKSLEPVEELIRTMRGEEQHPPRGDRG